MNNDVVVKTNNRIKEVKDFIVKGSMQNYENIMKASLILREKDTNVYWFDFSDVEILVQYDEGGYQGDSMALLKFFSNEYFIAKWGWGSCSGCDALQAAQNNANSLAELVIDFQSSISEKLESKEDVIKWLSKELQNTFDKELHNNFSHKIIEYFNSLERK